MRIAVISDIHGRVEKLELLSGVARKADVLVVAGDITNFGGRDEARKVLKPLLSAAGRLLAVPGNCDTAGVNHMLRELKVTLHGRGVVLGDVGFFGAGGSSATPFSTPQEYPEEELASLLERAHADVEGCRVRVMVSHSPPFGTPLDLTSSGVHAGSRAVKEFIKRHSPTLALCGHIHEARGSARVASTLVVNPGAAHMGYALVEVGESISVRLVDFV
ncbi:MAG: YfcE family phosphodiesterase [Euryarchaeota archaeon]|nr:YfcE family phosphodiesterase [Euryarchaeota archaeon]